MSWPDVSQGDPAEQMEGQLFAERLRLTRDGLINATAYAVSAVAGMVLVPVLLSGMSREMYGIWIAALAVQYSAAFLSGGLGRCVAREVASGDTEDTRRFVVAASNAYLLIGVTGALVIAAAGVPLASGLHVSANNLKVARLIFSLAGIGFFADQMQSLAMEILTGLRRFFTINAITIASVFCRAVGIIVILRVGGSIVLVALWHVLICLATGGTAYAAALRLAPQFRPRLLRFQWSDIRNQIWFSLVSQITAGCANVVWRSAPFLIGILRGAAAIVPYELGQKFPMSVSSISWQAGDVFFPAASEYHSAQQEEHTRQLLEVGTRGVLLLVLPFCIALWILAPQLLASWVGGRFPESVWILRVTTFAVLADSAAITSVQILWGKGQVEWVMKLAALSAVIGVVTACALIVRIGPLGAAIGVAAGVSVSAAGFILLTTRLCACSIRKVLLPSLKDLAIPALFASGTLLLFTTIHQREGWLFLVFSAALCFVVYALAFYFLSAQQVEKTVARGVILGLSRNLYAFYREFRRTLERVPMLRFAILFAVEIKNALLDSSPRDRAAVERLYREHEDPFGFNRVLEQFRFQRAIEMLQPVSNGSGFARALEVGCAEGMFTKRLAECCGTVVAVDLSKIALERAKQHCSHLSNVEFAEWDVRLDPVNGMFDLIVATGVLEYILRPSTLRDACERLTAGLRPGGYLLLGNTVTDTGVEHTWIGRKLIRGALINDYFANDVRYERIASSLDQCVCPFAHILLRKRPD